MNNTNIREFLSNCRWAALAVQAVNRQIDFVSLGSGGAPAPDPSKPVAIPTNEPLYRALQNWDCFDAAMTEHKLTLLNKLIELAEIISRLRNQCFETVIWYYYGMAWPENKIAHELGIDNKTIRKWRTNAVRVLERI